MLSSQALRAARLVVDSGIHALGWTRQQAIDYMLAHTAEDDRDVASEVDRYIIYPGQATAYMLGRLEIQQGARRRRSRRWGSGSTSSSFTIACSRTARCRLAYLHDKIRAWGQAK